MIRFIDLRYQGTGYRFTFWNTAVDRFFYLDGSQAWNTWDEFESEAAELGERPDQIQRCKNLCPDWVFNSTHTEERDSLDRLIESETPQRLR